MKVPRTTFPGLAGCRGVRLRFGRTVALDDLSFAVEKGETVAITGPSGCGKTSLLHVLSGLLRPDAGEVYFGSRELSAESDAARSRLRLTSFGFVLQFGDLVPELTLGENVELPLRMTGVRAAVAHRRALHLLEELGIGDLASRQAGAVSAEGLLGAGAALFVAPEPVSKKCAGAGAIRAKTRSPALPTKPELVRARSMPLPTFRSTMS